MNFIHALDNVFKFSKYSKKCLRYALSETATLTTKCICNMQVRFSRTPIVSTEKDVSLGCTVTMYWNLLSRSPKLGGRDRNTQKQTLAYVAPSEWIMTATCLSVIYESSILTWRVSLCDTFACLTNVSITWLLISHSIHLLIVSHLSCLLR